MRLPARHEVVALVQLREEPRDLRGVVLEVAVDRHDDVALDLAEAGVECRRLAQVAAQPHDADVVGAAWSRTSAAGVPSREPSSTKTTSHGSPRAEKARISSS